ncbi:triphosphoribosyl-dephospho-CoA synthase, partial [Pseudomonas taiwanensis]
MKALDLQPHGLLRQHRNSDASGNCAILVGAGSPAKRPAQATKLPLADHLADLAVEALIDEADLSPKPGLVDRRGNGAHHDMTLALMHASALALWPCLRNMAEAAQA